MANEQKKIWRRCITAHRQTLVNEFLLNVISGLVFFDRLEPHAQGERNAVVVVLGISADVGVIETPVDYRRECVVDGVAHVVDIGHVGIE